MGILNLGEFDWKYAKPGKGAVSAVVHGLKYLVLPLAVVLIWIFVTSREEGAEAFRPLLQDMEILVLVFGIVLTALGFFRGAYPKGSYSRLTFALVVAVLAIVFAFSLLLGGRVQKVLSDEVFELDLEILFVLYLVGAAFKVVMQLGEFVDHRPAFLQGGGQAVVHASEDPNEHRWNHDFRLRYGSLYQGLKLARSTLIGFVVLPLALIIILKAGLSTLNAQEVGELLTRLDDLFGYMLVLGLPMTCLAFFKGFYPRGSFSRLIPALIMVLISLYWIWTLGMEGKMALDTIEDISISVDYTGILLLILCGSALWLVYYALELLVYRREWKEGGFQKDLRERKKKDKKVEKETTAPPQENSSP
ncbi:MAG: hypothetical protein NT131_07485 [Methanomassiliicoccales archaeon]|nr:hypothetical protein [Methanomassiliicoccales archaeon]